MLRREGQRSHVSSHSSNNNLCYIILNAQFHSPNVDIYISYEVWISLTCRMPASVRSSSFSHVISYIKFDWFKSFGLIWRQLHRENQWKTLYYSTAFSGNPLTDFGHLGLRLQSWVPATGNEVPVICGRRNTGIGLKESWLIWLITLQVYR